METTLYEVGLLDGRKFRVFCRGKNQKKRFNKVWHPINEQFVLDGETRTKLYILPIVVDADSYEEVTEENMQYYYKNSEWVINFLNEVYG